MEILTPIEESHFVDLLKRKIDSTRVDQWGYIGTEGGHPGLPNVVAIGPINKQKKMDNSTEVRRGEFLKMEYLKAFFNRTNNITLESCVSHMKEWECKAYEFYNYSLDTKSLMLYSLTGDPRFIFLEMLLLDSCFIIEVIWRYTSIDVPDKRDHLSMPRLMLDARRDMILLGNQVPFFVLERLFSLAFNDHSNNSSTHLKNNDPLNNRSFVTLCITYLHDFMLIVDSSQAHENIRRQQEEVTEIKHFLDLLRICHAPSLISQPPVDPFRLISMPTATQLDGAGMVIRPSSTTVHYSGNLLEIPKIKINDKSEFLIKSLVNLELRDHQYDSYIINYLHFLDGLIKTGKDVDILVKNEVIENYLRDNNAVATLFNGITGEATLYAKNYYYYGICENLNKYCKVRSNRWRATLKRDYCNSPWMIASTIAIGILIGLTLIQTICSIISIT